MYLNCTIFSTMTIKIDISFTNYKTVSSLSNTCFIGTRRCLGRNGPSEINFFINIHA